MGEKSRVSRKITNIAITVGIIAMAAIIPVYAWFVAKSRITRTEDLVVDMPPIIYIRNSNLEEVTTFKLDGLKIGDDYNEVFCVSPALIGSVQNFFLGVIYTENLGMEINIYPVDAITNNAPTGEGTKSVERKVTLSSSLSGTCYFNYKETVSGYKKTYGGWTGTEKPTGANLNYGVYKSYNNLKFENPAEESDPLMKEMNNTKRYRFFILNITWHESDTGVDNGKEADIVYIVTKGKQ